MRKCVSGGGLDMAVSRDEKLSLRCGGDQLVPSQKQYILQFLQRNDGSYDNPPVEKRLALIRPNVCRGYHGEWRSVTVLVALFFTYAVLPSLSGAPRMALMLPPLQFVDLPTTDIKDALPESGVQSTELEMKGRASPSPICDG